MLFLFQPFPSEAAILKAASYKHYIDSFNANDNELYVQHISNAESWSFLERNIPWLDVPDKLIEQTYYFRWWTYRKHIEKTPEGFVITEFLPKVVWAGKYNTIPAAAGHHIYEGRWLADKQYIRDYARFWLSGPGSPRTYSFWIADSLFNYYRVTLDKELITELLPLLVRTYEAWEKEKLGVNGLFWQEDGQDGMELSICGALSNDATGYRATINSYMYGDAMAISKIALLTHQQAIADRFTSKAQAIKAKMQQTLWDGGADFFKVLPRGKDALCDARELHGYTPWYFNMPDERYSKAWKYLMDPDYFFAEYGTTTAEQNHRDFKLSYEGHECQWNGPSWPYATAIILTAAANLLNNYAQQYFSPKDYFKLLKIYTNSQQRTKDDGKVIPWMDEDLNPFTGDWIARTRLKRWSNGTWSQEKGGPERGKDYNHSTYDDLIVTGLIGLRPQEGDTLLINPLVPTSWDYFCLDNVHYHGKTVAVLYDRTGRRYRKGKGFMIFVDGEKRFSSPVVRKIEIAL
jgi:hypothetical protein